MNRPDSVDTPPVSTSPSETSEGPTSPAPAVHSSESLPVEAQRRGFLSYLYLLGFFLALVFGGLYLANYFYQGQVAAEVDPANIQPLVITIDSPDDSPSESPDDESKDETDALDPAEGPDSESLTGSINAESIARARHPLIPLLDIAERVRDNIQQTVRDYEAVIVKQVRVDGKLGDEQYMLVRIRHERNQGDETIPFSVYTRFLKPRSLAGQEAIWVKGWNDNKIIAHPAGLWNLVRVQLDPEGPLAMKGNRYPVYFIGMLNLVEMMLEKGEVGKQISDCQVRVQRGVQVDGVECCMLEITYPTRHAEIDFYQARIYIDTERDIPIAYEGYLWPESEGAEPPLLEKYFYTNIRLNIGLTDNDFDPDNPEYGFPGGD